MNYCKTNYVSGYKENVTSLSGATLDFLQGKDISKIKDISYNIDLQLAALEREIIIKYLLADLPLDIKRELWILSLDIKKTRDLLKDL